jgi:hypothetical protein
MTSDFRIRGVVAWLPQQFYGGLDTMLPPLRSARGRVKRVVGDHFSGSDLRPASGFQEHQQVGIDRVCLRSRHAVREALVGLQRPVLQ